MHNVFKVLDVLLESPSCMPKNKNIVLIDKIFLNTTVIFFGHQNDKNLDLDPDPDSPKFLDPDPQHRLKGVPT
jgi:hypothetical protein